LAYASAQVVAGIYVPIR